MFFHLILTQKVPVLVQTVAAVEPNAEAVPEAEVLNVVAAPVVVAADGEPVAEGPASLAEGVELVLNAVVAEPVLNVAAAAVLVAAAVNVAVAVRTVVPVVNVAAVILICHYLAEKALRVVQLFLLVICYYYPEKGYFLTVCLDY